MAEDTASARPRIFYGWYNVAAVLMIFTVATGFIFYNLSVLLQTLVETRGFSVSAVSGATSLCFLGSGVTGLAIAQVIDRIDLRWFIAGGGALAAAVLALFGEIDTVWEMYLAYGLLGVAYSGCSMVPGTTLITRWFHRNRSVALAAASTGFSLGGIVITPWTVWLIHAEGLDFAAPIMGLVMALGVVPVALLVLRPWPGQLGLHPDGDRPPPELADADLSHSAQTGFWPALGSRFFLCMTVATLTAMLAQIGVLTHLFHHVDIRTDAQTAALAVSIMAGCSIGGRLVGGVLLRSVSHRAFGLTIYAYHLVAVAMLGLADGPWTLPIAAGAFGLVVGNVVMLQPLLIGEAFGLALYARLYAVNTLIMTIGMAIGPYLVGALFESFGDYTPAYLAASLGGGIAFVMLLAAGRVPGR